METFKTLRKSVGVQLTQGGEMEEAGDFLFAISTWMPYFFFLKSK